MLNIRGQKSSGRKLRISLKSVVAVESLPAAILLFFLAMAYCTISSFLVIYADTRQVENIGLFFTVNAITLLASRPLVGRLMDKYGFRAVVLPALCCFALAMFVISMATELWMFLVAAFISAFGYGACQPAMQALAIKSVPESRRGSASATNYFGTDLGYLSGPSVAGSIVDSVNRGKASPAGYSAMYRCMMIPIGIAAGLLLTVLRKSIARIEQGAAERDKERAAAPAGVLPPLPGGSRTGSRRFRYGFLPRGGPGERSVPRGLFYAHREGPGGLPLLQAPASLHIP